MSLNGPANEVLENLICSHCDSVLALHELFQHIQNTHPVLSPDHARRYGIVSRPGKPGVKWMLGEGGKAKVYKVYDVVDQKVYALKTYELSYKEYLERKKKALDEISIVRSLQEDEKVGAHIVHLVYDELDDQRHEIRLFMELATGGNLRQFLKRFFGRSNTGVGIEWPFQITAISDLMNGLHYIHKKSVRHKDIKPENILIHEGRLLYADFGISFHFDPSILPNGTTNSTRPRYSYEYAAPEVYAKRERNKSSDVFSLGCVLLEILAARAVHEFGNFDPRRATVYEEEEDFVAYHDILKNRKLDAKIGTLIKALTERTGVTGLLDTAHVVRQMLQEDPKQRPDLGYCKQYIHGHSKLHSDNRENREHYFNNQSQTKWSIERSLLSHLGAHFLENVYHKHHYSQVAERARVLILDALEDMTDSNGQRILAKVLCRAKEKQSIREKLLMRERTKQYTSIDDILNDINDLAGVRIILYATGPQQQNKVKEMIHCIWGFNVQSKLDNTSKSSLITETPSLPGSRKSHYYVRMKKEHEGHSGLGEYQWSEHDKVEIQVMSALTHAWAEARYDMLYKTFASGTPTMEERRLLDSLNGLVFSGDLLLEEFQERAHKRTYKKIRNRDEFGIFLRNSDILQRLDVQKTGRNTTTCQEDFATGGVDILFRFLEKTGQNYPLVVCDALRALGYPNDPKPNLERILASFDPQLKPPQGLFAPLCLIRHMLGNEPAQEQSFKMQSFSEYVSIMINALRLLQIFAGGPGAANEFLKTKLKMTEEERDGLNLVFWQGQSFKSDTGDDEDTMKDDVKFQSACDWFQWQASDEKSVFGMFLRLAQIGVI